MNKIEQAYDLVEVQGKNIHEAAMTVPIPALGNYSRTLPPQLVNEEIGFRQLLMLLSPEWRVFGKTVKFPPINTVVLLCSELDENRCHRKYVKEKLVKLLQKHGIPVETEDSP